jgi:hypothetical protein
MMFHPQQRQQESHSEQETRQRKQIPTSDLECFAATGGFVLGATIVFSAAHFPLALPGLFGVLCVLFLLCLAFFYTCQWIAAHLWVEARHKVALTQIETRKGVQFPITAQMYSRFLLAHQNARFEPEMPLGCPLAAHMQAMGYDLCTFDVGKGDLWLLGTVYPFPAWMHTYDTNLFMQAYDEPERTISSMQALDCLKRACEWHGIELEEA